MSASCLPCLFAGDASEVRLNELMQRSDLKSDVLKLPHHGIKENNTIDFINQVNPQVAIVTCEDEKMLDKSSKKVLEEKECKIYYTSNGSIIYYSDGNQMKIIQ